MSKLFVLHLAVMEKIISDRVVDSALSLSQSQSQSYCYCPEVFYSFYITLPIIIFSCLRINMYFFN